MSSSPLPVHEFKRAVSSVGPQNIHTNTHRGRFLSPTRSASSLTVEHVYSNAGPHCKS